MTRLLEMVAAPERVETAEMARKIMAEINEQSKASQPALMQTSSSASYKSRRGYGEDHFGN